jgi:four helix bundle protein
VPGNFRDLAAYRLASQLAEDLHRSVRHWPRFEQYVIGGQMLRSAYSVGANIAEGTGRWHLKDRRRFLWIARGSLSETEHWILTAEAQGLLATGTSHRTDEVGRTLNGLIKKVPN